MKVTLILPDDDTSAISITAVGFLYMRAWTREVKDGIVLDLTEDKEQEHE